MKKILMGVIGAMMILSLAACTPTTEKERNELAASQTSSSVDGGKGVDYNRGVDETAPDLTVISIYTVNEDGDDIAAIMESITSDDFGPEVLVDILAYYGVLEDGTYVIDFDASNDLSGDEITGPGVTDNSVIVSSTATLNLNQMPDDELVVRAVARTFMENLNLESLTIQVNGETVADSLTIGDVE
jgi:hypothetical protein